MQTLGTYRLEDVEKEKDKIKEELPVELTKHTSGIFKGKIFQLSNQLKV